MVLVLDRYVYVCCAFVLNMGLTVLCRRSRLISISLRYMRKTPYTPLQHFYHITAGGWLAPPRPAWPGNAGRHVSADYGVLTWRHPWADS